MERASKESQFVIRASREEIDAWARAAKCAAEREGWSNPERSLSRLARKVLNESSVRELAERGSK